MFCETLLVVSFELLFPISTSCGEVFQEDPEKRYGGHADVLCGSIESCDSGNVKNTDEQ